MNIIQRFPYRRHSNNDTTPFCFILLLSSFVEKKKNSHWKYFIGKWNRVREINASNKCSNVLPRFCCIIERRNEIDLKNTTERRRKGNWKFFDKKKTPLWNLLDFYQNQSKYFPSPVYGRARTPYRSSSTFLRLRSPSFHLVVQNVPRNKYSKRYSKFSQFFFLFECNDNSWQKWKFRVSMKIFDGSDKIETKVFIL